jgi:hypothetical protein
MIDFNVCVSSLPVLNGLKYVPSKRATQLGDQQAEEEIKARCETQRAGEE